MNCLNLGHTSQRKSTMGRLGIKFKRLGTFKSVPKAKVVRPKTTNEKKINAEGQTWFYHRGYTERLQGSTK